MNKHDQRRKDALVKTLVKAQEQAETTLLYIVTNNPDSEDAYKTSLALEHVETALAYLSKGHDGTACRVCGCTEHHPCAGGCSWVETDLCSACARKESQLADDLSNTDTSSN